MQEKIEKGLVGCVGNKKPQQRCTPPATLLQRCCSSLFFEGRQVTKCTGMFCLVTLTMLPWE
jgi:hypothetical protein